MKKLRIVYAVVNPKDIVGKIIRNSKYNEKHVSLHGWCYVPHEKPHNKPQFHAAMRESIKKEGIRNPIILYSLPEGLFLSFGGSRLRAARALGLDGIPAIVNDYTGELDGQEVTPDNWQTFFTDVPDYFEFTEDGVETHYSIERRRRSAVDRKGLKWCEGAEWLKEEFPWT